MAKSSGGIATKVEQLVRPVIEELGLQLWDVRYEKEGAGWFLRVLIDREGEVLDTDTCEIASRAIDPILDEADPVPQAYFLEVGSPGLGRQLVKDEHFEAKKGQKVRAHLIRPDEDGNREVAGILLGKVDGKVHVKTETGEIEIEEKEASSFKQCDDEDLF